MIDGSCSSLRLHALLFFRVEVVVVGGDGEHPSATCARGVVVLVVRLKVGDAGHVHSARLRLWASVRIVGVRHLGGTGERGKVASCEGYCWRTCVVRRRARAP